MQSCRFSKTPNAPSPWHGGGGRRRSGTPGCKSVASGRPSMQGTRARWRHRAKIGPHPRAARHKDGAMHLTGRQWVQSRQHVDSPGRARTDLSLAWSALWLMVPKIVAFALNVAVPLVLVRELTVREFGVYKQLF